MIEEPPQNRMVALYEFEGVNGSMTVAAEAGYVRTALLTRITRKICSMPIM